MSQPRRVTDDSPLGERIAAFLDDLDLRQDRDQFASLLATVADLAADRPDRLDIKIASAALREMRQAFQVFGPYRDVPKVTIFGSARTPVDDPLYAHTRAVAAGLAQRGWMVITGGGPGVMAAGLEGAGRDMSFGINIRLPFEQEASEVIATDPKLVEMKYFFTRKLMLMKESDGFIAMPGGFGTLDETFELLTLMQTGKAEPCPLVLLDVPGGTYWAEWLAFVRHELGERALINEEDYGLFRILDDAEEAIAEITGFYRNYHSRRFVRDLLVIRLRCAPTDEEIEQLNAEFADIVSSGRIERTEPLAPEVRGRDHLAMARIAFRFNRADHARLRALIDAVNRLASAPTEIAGPPDREVVAGGQPMEPDVRSRDDEAAEAGGAA